MLNKLWAALGGAVLVGLIVRTIKQSGRRERAAEQVSEQAQKNTTVLSAQVAAAKAPPKEKRRRFLSRFSKKRS